MGPLLLVDKSFIQSLSPREADALHKHFMVLLCPVLLHEIIAGLAKADFQPDEAQSRVIHLLSKAKGLGAKVLHEAGSVIATDMIRGGVPFGKGGVLKFGGTPATAPDGSKGIIFEESEEERLIRRWASNTFSEEDRKRAEVHRRDLDEYDLQKEEMQRQFPNNMRFADLDAVAKDIDRSDQIQEMQWPNISTAAMLPPLRPDQLAKVKARWDQEGQLLFHKFAPYAHHCSRVMNIFYIGVTAGHVSTSKSQKTLIDILYFHYLPQAFAFCSSDRFHEHMFKYFARPDQTFIWGPDLKKDLSVIASFHESLSPKDRIDFDREFGHYPPPIPNSVTQAVWAQHMRPWQPGSGNQIHNQTPEELHKTLEYLKGILRSAGKGDDSK